MFQKMKFFIKEAVVDDAKDIVVYSNKIGGESDYVDIEENGYWHNIEEEINHIEKCHQDQGTLIFLARVMFDLITSYWSKRPTTVPADNDHYFHLECPSIRPKTSKSSDNHSRPSGSLITPIL